MVKEYRAPLELKTGKMFRQQGTIEHRAQVCVGCVCVCGGGGEVGGGVHVHISVYTNIMYSSICGNVEMVSIATK